MFTFLLNGKPVYNGENESACLHTGRTPYITIYRFFFTKQG